MRLKAGRPVEVFALTWESADEQKTGATIGEPGSQALWEAYMMLRRLWARVTTNGQGYIRVRGDAQGVLAALVKRAAKSPLLNEVTKEAALHLAVHFASIEALHLWSEQNEWADALSGARHLENFPTCQGWSPSVADREGRPG